jgi:hypothetical protein
VSLLINPYAFQPVLPAATLEYRALKSASNQNASTLTVSSCDIGTAAVGRHVFALVFFNHQLSVVTVPSATIGGVVAKVHAHAIDSAGTDSRYNSVLISAPIDAGSTADISIALSGTRFCNYIRFATYKVLGLQSDTPIDTVAVETNSGSTHNYTIDVEQDGIVIAGDNSYTTNSNVTWAGVVEDFDSAVNPGERYSGGSLEVLATAASFPFSTTTSGGRSSAMVAGSFR